MFNCVVVVKGNKDAAIRQFEQRKITVVGLRDTTESEVVFIVKSTAEVINSWYCEDLRAKGPYPIGALLWWGPEI